MDKLKAKVVYVPELEEYIVKVFDKTWINVCSGKHHVCVWDSEIDAKVYIDTNDRLELVEDEKEKYFEIKEIKRLEDGEPYLIDIVDSNYRNMSISLKWDGCIDLRKYNNGSTVDDEDIPEDNMDYIHICEVKDMIRRLQEVVDIAQQNFSEDNFENYWED